jgi:hypothetical protein
MLGRRADCIRKVSSVMEPPPDKRRKTDNRTTPAPSSVDDLWVDDDLENIDALILSQAICDNNNAASVSKSSTIIQPTPRVLGKGTAKSRSSNDALTSTYGTTAQKPTGTESHHSRGGMVAHTGHGSRGDNASTVSSSTRSTFPKSSSTSSLVSADLELVKAENERLQKQVKYNVVLM